MRQRASAGDESGDALGESLGLIRVLHRQMPQQMRYLPVIPVMDRPGDHVGELRCRPVAFLGVPLSLRCQGPQVRGPAGLPGVFHAALDVARVLQFPHPSPHRA